MRCVASLEKNLDNKNDIKSFLTLSAEKHSLKLIPSKKGIFSTQVEEETQDNDYLSRDDYAKIKNCISCITDPLWKNICIDLVNTMGPFSVLKIWKSKLGEFYIQDKGLDIICETEETANFVQKYDFVILGSLRKYFPSLKKLRIKNITR